MIAQRLKQLADTQPEKTALQIRRADGTYSKISFGDLYKNCLGVKAKLESMGFKPSDRVSVYGDNSPEWVVSYLGIHFMGGVVVPLDALLAPEDIYNFIEFSEAKAVIADASHIDKLRDELSSKNKDIEVLSMESIAGESEIAETSEPHKGEPNELLAILFTSGTTGVPKGVQLTNDNIFSNIDSILKSVDVGQEDNILNILPVHHGYSSIVALLTPLCAGATVTFTESIKSTDLLAAMKETGVTIFPGVPRLFELLLNEIQNKISALPFMQKIIFNSLFKVSELGWSSMNLRIGRIFFGKVHEPFGQKLRFFTSGGAKLDPKVYSGFLSLGFKIAEGYGMTETSAVSTLTSPDEINPGSAGRPLYGIELKIHNPDDTGTGEICIKGKNITPGYYKNESATKELLKDGWLHTGDLGTIDSENNVFITGRAKEVIVLPSGKNIYPEDIESQYNKHPIIKEICVTPWYSESGAIKGLATVVVPNMREIRERNVFDVRERVRSIISMTGSNLPSYMQISDVYIYNDELPKTRLGKFKRSEIEKLAEELKSGAETAKKELTPEQNELLKKPVSIKFLKRFSEITKLKGPFHPSEDLTLDLGIDSLTLVEITAVLEKEFATEIEEKDYPDVRTVGDILVRLPDTAPDVREGHVSVEDSLEAGSRESLEDLFNIKRGLITRAFMRALQLFVRLIVLITFRSRLHGTRKIPKNRAVLICPNHQSLIDPILIFALLPGHLLNKTLFTGFGEYFSKAPLSWMVRPLRIIMTGTSRTNTESLRLASEGLKLGMSVCIFPEGERTSTGKVMEPRIGTGVLSVETGTLIVPIYIDGATKTLSPVHRVLSFPKVTLTVLDPIDPASGDKDEKELFQDTVDNWKEVIKDYEENRG